MKRRIWDGAKLVAQMALCNVNAVEVADAVDVTRQVVSNWRHGIEPRAERVKKLAKLLRCKPDDFFVEFTQ
jgi:transcriptional regulator with XRE-family HTH domain